MTRKSVSTGDESRRAAGVTTRRAVLGDAHVDASNASITPETADFQDFITRYAWGEIWTRPGLTRRERSLVTLSSLVTGGREREIAAHVRAALINGLSRAEVSETILHTAIYAGVPAASAGFAIASEVFAELDAGVHAENRQGPSDQGQLDQRSSDQGQPDQRQPDQTARPETARPGPPDRGDN